MCMLNALAHQSSMQELDLLNPQLDPRITFTRASSKTYFGSNGLMQTAANDVWPLEYDPITLKPIGRSVWEQRTNLILQSQTFTSATWAKVSSGLGSAPTVTADAATAPDGNATATLLQFRLNGGTSASDYSMLQQSFSRTNALQYAHSVYIKAATPADVGKTLVLRGAAGSSYSVITVSAAWTRVQVVEVAPNTGTAFLQFGARATFGASDSIDVLVWGMQVEQAAFASPYIPTAGSQVTRVADDAFFNPLGIRFNPAGMTFVSAARSTPVNVLDQVLVQLDAGADSQRWLLYRRLAGPGASSAAMRSAGSPGDVIGPLIPTDTRYKMAAAFEADNLRISASGSVPAQDTTAGMPTGLVTGRIGRTAGGTARTNAPIERIAFYPCPVANSELQALTA